MSLFPKVGRKQIGLRISWWLLVAFLCLGILLHLFPFYFMIAMSFTPATELMQPTPTFFPREPTTAAWELVWSMASRSKIGEFNPPAQALLKQPFSVYFGNSLLMTFGTLLLSLPITSFAAYANSKLQRGPKARWTFLFFIGTLMIPGVVTLISSFLLTLSFPFPVPKGQAPLIPGTETQFPVITIWNTLWAVIIPGVFNAFNFLLFKGFFDTIPDSIIQAARVDGGSEFNIFRRIIFPMSVPVYAVAAWLQFSGVWDSYLWPLIVLQDADKKPITVAIATLVQEFTRSNVTSAEAASGVALNPRLREILAAGLSWNGLVVLGILQSLPIFIMFIVCREYLMQGIRIRGLR